MFPAFTLILPLFPALISHYRENDSSGLFRFLETKVMMMTASQLSHYVSLHLPRLTPSEFLSVLLPSLTPSSLEGSSALSSPSSSSSPVPSLEVSVTGSEGNPWWSEPALVMLTLTYWSLLPITGLVRSGISFSYLVWVLSSNFALFVLARVIGGISKGDY